MTAVGPARPCAPSVPSVVLTTKLLAPALRSQVVARARAVLAGDLPDDSALALLDDPEVRNLRAQVLAAQPRAIEAAA